MMLIDTAELMSVADVLPIDLKIQLIDKLLISLNLSSYSVGDTWQKQAQQQTLTIPKLNPLHYAKAPTEPFQAIAENKAELDFSDIEDSTAFAKKLRQQAWQRHE
jgi:hypothetical protein